MMSFTHCLSDDLFSTLSFLAVFQHHLLYKRLPSVCTELSVVKYTYIFFFSQIKRCLGCKSSIWFYSPLYMINTNIMCTCLFKFHHFYCTAKELITLGWMWEFLSVLTRVLILWIWLLNVSVHLHLLLLVSVLMKSNFCFDCWYILWPL